MITTIHNNNLTSPCVFSLLGAMASNSSMKMMAGLFFSASSKAFLKLLSDSPANLDMISGPLMRKKKAPVSLATARAIKVLPVPGGPVQCKRGRGKSYCQDHLSYYERKGEIMQTRMCKRLSSRAMPSVTISITIPPN